jgi:hypothetical protein
MNHQMRCDEYTKLLQLAELTTLHKSFNVIVGLADQCHESKVGFSSIGAVEAVVVVMSTFPKCEALQSSACRALRSLANCSIGKKKAVEMGGMHVLLAAVNNHLDSALVCEYAIWAMRIMFSGGKENMGQFISLGGATALAIVRHKWPDNDTVQTHVRILTKLIMEEMKYWI